MHEVIRPADGARSRASLWTSGDVRLILVVAAVGVGLRVVFRALYGEASFWQNGYTFYFDFAQHLAAGQGLASDAGPSAMRVPFYPIFLALVTLGHHAFWAVLLAQALVGGCTVVLTARLATELFDRRAAVLAAIVCAAYPYYVVHDTAIQETGLITCVTAAAVLVCLRAARTGSVSRAALAGFLLGVAVLTRVTLLPFAVFAAAWLAWRLNGAAGLKLRALGVCLGLVALLLAPWLMWSDHVTGRPGLSTEIGLNLWVSNNALTFSHYPDGAMDQSEAAARAALSERDLAELHARIGDPLATDRWYFDRAMTYIRAHPFATVVNGLRKIRAVFSWLPSPRHTFWLTVGYTASYAPVMTLGVLGLWVRRRSWQEDSLIYALFLSFMVITAVFFGQTSHRSFLDVYLIAYAAGWATSGYRVRVARQAGVDVDR